MSDWKQPSVPRTELAMRMLCAWNNLPIGSAPPEWFAHPSDQNRMAWERVAQAAADYLEEGRQ
jgi:hypothetical protein